MIFGRTSLLVGLLAVFAATQHVVAEEKCHLMVGYEADPFQFPDASGRMIGVDVDILRAALADVGCTVGFTVRPWSRTLLELKNGKLDIAMGASLKSERTGFAHYSHSYRGHPHTVIALKSTQLAARDLREFLQNGNRLGVVLGWHYTDKIRSLIDDRAYRKQILVVPRSELLPEILKHGRVEGTLGNPSEFASHIGKQNFRSNYKLIRADIDLLHFIFSKKSVNKTLFDKFNRHLKRRLDEGMFSKACTPFQNKFITPCSFLSVVPVTN